MRRITVISCLLIFLAVVASSVPLIAQNTRVLVAKDSPKRVLIPSPQNGGDKLGTAWHAVDFDGSAWRAGKGGVGLETRGEDYKPFFSIDVEKEMFDKQTSAFIRIPFTVEGAVPGLQLRVRYDDGFVAYLNGVEVARALFQGEPKWNSVSENRMVNDESKLPFEDFDISASVGALKQGKNLLAIHGMQDRPNSSDFLICVELRAGAEAAVAQATSQTQAAQSAAAAQVAQPPQFQAALLVEVPKSEVPVGEDWPQWRGPHGNGKSGVKEIKKDWSGGLRKLWEVDDLCRGEGDISTWSAPSILGDKLVIPGWNNGKDVIFCFNAITGELIWMREYAIKQHNRQGGTRYGKGSRAAPCIDGDRVYTFGGWGDLVCWKLESGEELWRKNMDALGGLPANFGYVSSPLVYKETVIVHGGGDVMVVAFNKMTGQMVWKCSWDDGGSGRPGYGSPMVHNLGGRDQILTSVTAAGTRRGRHGPGRVAGLDPEYGVVLWEVPWWCFYEIFQTPVVEGSIAVVVTGMRSGSMALNIDRSGATQIWENWGNDILSPSHSLPVILGGYVYGYSGHSSDYYEQDRPGRELQCVDLSTGRLQWRGGPDAGWGTLIYVDGHLLCLTDQGKLLLVDPKPTEYRKVTEFQTDLQIDDSGYPEKSQFAWTHPVVAHGKVYVRYCNRLICYDLEN